MSSLLIPLRSAAGGSAPTSLGEGGGDEAVMSAGEEHGGGETEFGDGVAMGGGVALDEAGRAQPSQVAGHHPGLGHGAGRQGGEELLRVAVGEPGGQGAETDQRQGQGLGGGGMEAQCGHPLAVDNEGLAHLLEGGGSDGRIAADSLHLEDAPVGGEADQCQVWEIVQSAAGSEIVGVVDGALSTSGPVQFEVVLGASRFVVVEVFLNDLSSTAIRPAHARLISDVSGSVR